MSQPDTSAVVEDIARGRACLTAGHESKIAQLTRELETERSRAQRANQHAYAAQQGLTAIATAMGLPIPVDGFDGSKVDVLPILDEISRLAGRPLDEETVKEAPTSEERPKSAAQKAGQDLGVQIGNQLMEALKPLGEQLLADIKAAATRGRTPR